MDITVRTGITDIAYEILLDVMRRILAHLAEKELWVLAFQLLKDIDMVMKLRKRFFQFDAGTILLFIEVYLANQQAIEALALLQSELALQFFFAKFFNNKDHSKLN